MYNKADSRLVTVKAVIYSGPFHCRAATSCNTLSTRRLNLLTLMLPLSQEVGSA